MGKKSQQRRRLTQKDNVKQPQKMNETCSCNPVDTVEQSGPLSIYPPIRLEWSPVCYPIKVALSVYSWIRVVLSLLPNQSGPLCPFINEWSSVYYPISVALSAHSWITVILCLLPNQLPSLSIYSWITVILCLLPNQLPSLSVYSWIRVVRSLSIHLSISLSTTDFTPRDPSQE